MIAQPDCPACKMPMYIGLGTQPPKCDNRACVKCDQYVPHGRPETVDIAVRPDGTPYLYDMDGAIPQHAQCRCAPMVADVDFTPVRRACDLCGHERSALRSEMLLRVCRDAKGCQIRLARRANLDAFQRW